MKTFLAITVIAFLTACGPDPDRPDKNDKNDQNDKSYTVTTDNGKLCNVMIRKSNTSYRNYTLQCPSGTKIGCMRVYDNSNFIIGAKSRFVSTTSFGLVAADGYGDGTVLVSNFESIAQVSLHSNSCD